MAILPKAFKPDNIELPKTYFTNIQGLCSNFAGFESFFESNSLDILALCETNLNNSIDSSISLVRGYLPLMQKDSVTCMHSLAVFVKERLSFAHELSLENSEDSYFAFDWYYFI